MATVPPAIRTIVRIILPRLKLPDVTVDLAGRRVVGTVWGMVVHDRADREIGFDDGVQIAAGGGRRAGRVQVRTLDRHRAADTVERVFDGLSARSRYLRFHTPMPRLVPVVRRGLIDIDGPDRAAVVAEVAAPPGGYEPIGIARLAGTGAGRAEMAVAVVDAWQRRGVGRRLLSALRDEATALGYRELYGDILPENAAMLGLARTVFPAARTTWDGDVIRVTCPLGPAALELTHEDLLADLLSAW